MGSQITETRKKFLRKEVIFLFLVVPFFPRLFFCFLNTGVIGVTVDFISKLISFSFNSEDQVQRRKRRIKNLSHHQTNNNSNNNNQTNQLNQGAVFDIDCSAPFIPFIGLGRHNTKCQIFGKVHTKNQLQDVSFSSFVRQKFGTANEPTPYLPYYPCFIPSISVNASLQVRR